MEIQIDMYQTLALSVVVLMLGQFLKQKMPYTVSSVKLCNLPPRSFKAFGMI